MTNLHLETRIDNLNLRGIACVRCGGSTLGQSHRSLANGHTEHIDACPPEAITYGPLSFGDACKKQS